MTRDRLVAGAVGLLAWLVHGTVTVLHFRQLRINSWDNAIFEQAVASYARLDAPVVDIKAPGFNILGDHWSPIDALIAPVYWIFPSAVTILLAQVFLIAVSAVIITRLATRILGTWRGALLGVLYALSFGIQAAVVADFHEVAFALPFLAMAGTAYVDRRYPAMIGWALPLLLVKEDMGATVAMIGLVLWIAGERKRGVQVFVGGLLAVLVTTVVLIPSFGSGYDYTSQIGSGRGVIDTLLASADQKVVTVVMTLAVVGFACLFSPWVLLVLPTFAWRFVGDNPFYWGLDWHYGMVLMPIVFVAFIDAWERHRTRWMNVPLAIGTVVTCVVVPMVMTSPVAELAKSSTWDDPPRAAAGRAAIAAVPEDVKVVTDIALLKHLVTHRDAYWLGTVESGRYAIDPDYLAFDLGAGLGSPPDPVAYAETQYGGAWSVVFDRDGYVVVKQDR